MTQSGDETSEIAPPAAAPEAAPDNTVAFEAQHAHLHPGYVALIFCVVAAAAFLVGIGIAAASRPRPHALGRLVVSQRVGPSGAVIRFDDGQLEIPSGALSQPVRIVIRRSTFTDRVRVAPAKGATQVYNAGALPAYAFGPRDVVFNRPVRIVFRLPQTSHNGTVFARTGDTIVILGGSVDPDRETTTITTTDFRFAEGGTS